MSEIDQAPSAIAAERSGAAGKISLTRLFYTWFLLGTQSFGGGTATLFMIRRAAVDQHRWLSPEEFTRDWAISQASPGINLLCITILLGRRVRGLAGALVALIGLLLPSVTITVLMTALYADLRNLPITQAALHGVVPATVGLGLMLSVNMVRPLLQASHHESNFSLGVSIAIVAGSALAVLVWELPVVYVLLGAAAVGGVARWAEVSRRKAAQP